jgi:cytochrome P450
MNSTSRGTPVTRCANYLSAPERRGNAVEPFDIRLPLIDADPFPFYTELRDKYPCYWSDGAQLWILSRYDDVVEAARGRQHDRRASRARLAEPILEIGWSPRSPCGVSSSACPTII